MKRTELDDGLSQELDHLLESSWEIEASSDFTSEIMRRVQDEALPPITAPWKGSLAILGGVAACAFLAAVFGLVPQGGVRIDDTLALALVAMLASCLLALLPLELADYV